MLASSLNPARAMGFDRQKGAIAVGKDADLVVLDDEYNVRTTLVGGEVVYRA